jgi:hypothetical protein
VNYRLPYEDDLSTSETNENRILDILYRVVVNERKRPKLHRVLDMNSVGEIHRTNSDGNVRFLCYVQMIEQVFDIIDDCWKHEPDSRINARPALSRLRRLQQDEK